MEEQKIITLTSSELDVIRNLSNDVSYYGGSIRLPMSYISDMHLDAHLSNTVSVRHLLTRTIKKLYNSMNKKGVIIFAGDTASDFDLCIRFYRDFVNYYNYIQYKKKKKRLMFIRDFMVNYDERKSDLFCNIHRLSNYISLLKSKLFFNFKLIVNYKQLHCTGKSWVDSTNLFLSISSRDSVRRLTDDEKKLILLIADKLDVLDRLNKKYDNYIIPDYMIDVECQFKRNISDISISDMYTDHVRLTDKMKVFVVLGNHEYSQFDSINECDLSYDKELSNLGIILLNNKATLFKHYGEPCVIYGGAGWGKYNEKYNANSLIGPRLFSRNDEIQESDWFLDGYNYYKNKANDLNACFICVSHYPVNDWMRSIDNDVVYFYGHNHQNKYKRDLMAVIYADNQIGYRNEIAGFKVGYTGFEVNPYVLLSDGLHKTTVEDYLQYYRYIGEFISGDGKLLRQRYSDKNVEFYVMKSNNYYGFFTINSKKGIAIVNGGMTINVTKQKDPEWIISNFDKQLTYYLSIMFPLRAKQDLLSQELKQLGFSGDIHGCIVDIDYYHHIMIDPFTGNMVYYYSPSVGIIRVMDNFKQVLLNMSRNSTMVSSILNKLNDSSTYNIVGLYEDSYMPLYIGTNDGLQKTGDLQSIDTFSGIYGLSRNAHKLQRLFSGHVLRAFDENILTNKLKA